MSTTMAPNARRSVRSSPYPAPQQVSEKGPAGNPAVATTDSSKRRRRRHHHHHESSTKKSRQYDVVERDERSSKSEKADNSSNGTTTTNGDWVEPPLRQPVPSYEDTPWSGVSNANNPVLQTMRPLGQAPTTADMRKVGLLHSSKPSPRQTPAANDTSKPSPPVAAAGKKQRSSHPSSNKAITTGNKSTAKEEVAWADNSKAGFAEDLAALARLPLPDGTDFDVAKLKTVIEAAMHLASQSGSRVVSLGLLRIWANSRDDPFMLYVLDGMVNGSGPREVAAFQTLIHRAVHEVRQERELAAADHQAAPPAAEVHRSGSVVSSTSALSSAKSLDDDAFAAGPEEPPQETFEAKQNRLRQPVPDIVPPESNLRSSLSRESRSLTPPSSRADEEMYDVSDML